MKRTFILLFFVMCFASFMQARTSTVTTKAEFTTAWGALGGTNESVDTIFVQNVNGEVINTGQIKTDAMPQAGKIFVIGIPDAEGNLPILQTEINFPTIPDGNLLSIFFEKIHIQYRSGNSASSGQVFYMNKQYCPMDSVVFRNCEISNIARSFYRSVPVTLKDIAGNDSVSESGTTLYEDGGDINYFEMSGCSMHDCCISTGNNWPMIYFGQKPVEVIISNNTFYNLPYTKGLFLMNYINESTGRNAQFYFENNTVMIASMGNTAGYTILNTGTYLGEETEFHINNNLLLMPNFVNDLNVEVTTAPKILACTYGLVHASNNVIEGYRDWSAGNNKNEEGEYTWLECDTVNNFTMAEVDLEWGDFTNPEGGDFSYLMTETIATASTEEGPIGDPRWVKSLDNPVYLTTSVITTDALVSADSIGAVITPAKGVFESGTEITLEASAATGAIFTNWQNALGIVLSTENPYIITLTEDIEVFAFYTLKPEAALSVTIEGSTTASYTIEPVQEIYYQGDEVTVTLNTHYLNKFLGWGDVDALDLSRTFTLTEDTHLTASFEEVKFLAAWDFCHLEKNNQTLDTFQVADHYISAVAPTLTLKHYYTTTGEYGDSLFQTRNNKHFAYGADSVDTYFNCALRKTPLESLNAGKDDYHYIVLSTKGYKNITVSSVVATDNKANKVQWMQYSLDGENYTTFASVELSAPGSAWSDLAGVLPEEANDQEVVYVRWIADLESEVLLGESSDNSFEYVFLGNIQVLYGGIAYVPTETWSAAAYGEAFAVAHGTGMLTSGTVYDELVKNLTFIPCGTVDWNYQCEPAETFAATFEYNGVTYGQAIVQEPSNSGKDAYVKAGTAAAQFIPETDGTLDVVIRFGNNKKFYVADIPGDATVNLESTDEMANYTYNSSQYWGGYFSGVDGSYGTEQVAGETYYTGITLDVKAGHSYYLWFAGSKIMISGFTFKVGDGIENTVSGKVKTLGTYYYNVSGVQQKQLGKGLNIVKSVLENGQVKVEKVYVK